MRTGLVDPMAQSEAEGATTPGTPMRRSFSHRWRRRLPSLPFSARSRRLEVVGVRGSLGFEGVVWRLAAVAAAAAAVAAEGVRRGVSWMGIWRGGWLVLGVEL